jgi:hypothetical protein
MSVIYVTAIYKIYERPYAEEVWSRFQTLAETVPVHLFCSAEDVPRASAITGNVTIHVKEFETFECHPIMMSAPRLPEQRSKEKDTHNFMILMNAKTECLKLAKDAHPNHDYYVWLDAGISKIFQVPFASFSYLTRTMPQIRTDKIIIPGCWGYAVQGILVTKYVNWRFCGGFFVVPNAHVDVFHTKMIGAIQEVVSAADIAIWETNIWAYMELRLPIRWMHADHNETLFVILEQLR